jgi:hypothetical protein
MRPWSVVKHLGAPLVNVAHEQRRKLSPAAFRVETLYSVFDFLGWQRYLDEFLSLFDHRLALSF